MRKSLGDEREPWDADWDAERQTKTLAALALVLALALCGCYLVIHLRAAGQFENCLLARHSNCATLIGPR